MSERDELREILRFLCKRFLNADLTMSQHREMADALMTAGFRKPRVDRERLFTTITKWLAEKSAPEINSAFIPRAVWSLTDAILALLSTPKMETASDGVDPQMAYELFEDGPDRWVLTENYDEDNAPVFKTIQEAFDWCSRDEMKFSIKVYGPAPMSQLPLPSVEPSAIETARELDAYRKLRFMLTGTLATLEECLKILPYENNIDGDNIKRSHERVVYYGKETLSETPENLDTLLTSRDAATIERCAKELDERAKRYKHHIGDIGAEDELAAIAIRALEPKP